MWAPALSAVLSVFVDSRALRRGAGDEESEEEVTEMTSWGRRDDSCYDLTRLGLERGGEERFFDGRCRGSLDREDDERREAPA